MLSLRAARAFTTAIAKKSNTLCPGRSLASVGSTQRTMSSASIDENDSAGSAPTFDTAGCIGNDIEAAMTSLYKADAVCFDVDSTVIAEEGIDVLAEYLGKGEEVAALTRAAMEGGMAFQDALQARLDLLKPSRQSILDCLRDQPLVITPGMTDLMKALHEKQVDVWLVSGGFRIMIEPIAEQLDIPRDRIYANTLLFENDEAGTYRTFDSNEPTSADMGKPKAIQDIKDQSGYGTMVMVGDGATDAQAKPPANAFIGFGGVVERAAVKAKADWFVTDFQDMTRIVQQRSSTNTN